MKLELNVINIKRVQFGSKTSVNNGVLSVNREELTALLKEDPRLGEIDLELANPGDKCRLTRIMDVIEPRARIGADATNFPGAVGRQGPVGHGITCVLRGAAVMTSEAFPANLGPSIRAIGGLVDMWGPGADAGPYGKTCNLVIIPSPSKGISLPEYQIALKIAGLKAAVYLGKAGADMAPDKVETYEIPPLAEAGGSAGLPRVAYIMQLFSNQQLALPSDPVLYGDNIDAIVPAILHPNELFDGAIAVPYRSGAIETYTVQNHPMLLELYKHHNKDLYLAGVIITRAANNGPDIQRVGNFAANLAKWTLGVDGVILTKFGGGAPEMTMADTAQRCEKLGIKTVLAINHAGMDVTETTLKVSTIFSNVPEIDAMVSLGTGAGGPDITLPAAERVIGMVDGSALSGELVRPVSQIKGSQSLVGSTKWMSVRY